MYHIFEVFATIQHKQILPPAFLTLARNYTYLFYIVHWMACILVFVPLIDGFSPDTWFGRDEALARLAAEDAWADYLYSFYFSLGVFTGFSNEVFYKNNAIEAIMLCVYFVINVVAQAYILGTITVLLVKRDVESGEYRNAVINLDNYLSDKKLPKSLQAAMREHLELQSYSERTADENVLKHHPSTIKQKVLWHLYKDVLRDCYLLAGCTPQFLNLLLSVARMELFMPNVTITQQGDTDGDLLIIADGIVSVAPPSLQSAATDLHGSALSMGGLETSEHGSMPRSLGGADMSEHGSMCMDVSTPLPQMASGLANPSSAKHRDSAMSVDNAPAFPTSIKDRDSAMNTSTVKMTRFGGEALMTKDSTKGADTCIVIGDGGTDGKGEDSIARKNEGIMWNILQSEDSSNGRGCAAQGGESSSQGGSSFTSVSSRQQSFMHGPSSRAATLGTSDPLGEVPFLAEGVYTSAARTCSVTRVLLISYTDFQRLAESNPKDVSRVFKNLVKRTEKKLEELARQAMDAGQLGPTTAHALVHIAEGEPIESVSSIQLAGIKRSLTAAQLTVLQHLSEVRRLYKEDARKHQSLRVNACLNAAFNGNTPKLQALLAESRGRDASATDYDNRSALMLACRQNHVDTVEMLLKAGAGTSTVDSLGYTALFEAVRKGNDGCISHLLNCNATLGVEPRMISPFIFQAILSKDLAFLQRLVRVGADLDCTDLDGRTPLFLAASEGLLEVVILLVEEAEVTVDAVDSWGHTPEGDARLAGHHEVAQYLRKVQGSGQQALPVSQSPFAATSAQQAEEPSTQATEESPWQSGEHVLCPAHSSRSAAQLTFRTGSRGLLPSSSRPSIDHKRQELRRSMRNRTVSVNGTGRSRLGPSFSGTQRRPRTPTAFEEQLPPISSSKPSCSPSPRPMTLPALEEQSPLLFPAKPAASLNRKPMTPTAFKEQQSPVSSSKPAGSLSPRPATNPATKELPPPITPANLACPMSNPSSRLQSAFKLIENPSFEELDVLKTPSTSTAGQATFDWANRPEGEPSTEQAQALPKVSGFLAETTEGKEPGHSAVLPFVDPESLIAPPSLGKPDVPRPPGTSPAGWLAFDGADRPRSEPHIEQAQARPQVASFLPETTGGNETEHSVVLPFVDPDSLLAPPSLGKPDVPRPPGTSPAALVTFDRDDRPRSNPYIEQAQAPSPPQVGSFLPETTESREPGHSMVLPCRS
ncbi:hypothetical protein DUNSADRAFT_1806 [Dunaliella salina]|uniref:Cyclic nucleotide-binding domain-containing protein n=1 Tax=Dunaliella salina TaxID=3046 RepID=A0ABQ7FX27_DUNSA|nr:hypothetical protein DUNSADRAFT_1806 [Dunaliella salina]|eukprot:KAF5826900.1 hypothetical protein DUNSADRAFT_1806 [Dunaliella salina]